jgi:hypothetical protein
MSSKNFGILRKMKFQFAKIANFVMSVQIAVIFCRTKIINFPNPQIAVTIHILPSGKNRVKNEKPFLNYSQLDAMDCGATCFRTVAKYYGKNYTLETLRVQTYITREGVSLLGISDAAEKSVCTTV